MRLKTAPRIVIALVILGAAAWGLNTWLDKRPETPVVPQEAVVQPTVVPEVQPVQPPIQAAQPVQPQPVQPAPAPQPRPKTRDDAGMDALLGGK